MQSPQAFISSFRQACRDSAQTRGTCSGNPENLRAIIHGVGPRAGEARQAYIVKHAEATFEGIAPSISRTKAIRAMHLPVELTSSRKFG